MFAIGLTGGIGSGKTTVADMFAARGASVVDTDLIAHRITAPGGLAMPAIEHAFGPDFVAADGSLDRARMRALIFSDDDARRRLEAITHPLIRAQTDREARAAQGPYVMFVVPLLVESGNWKTRSNRVLVVDCPVETQIARVMRRNGFTREQVEAIIARQATRDARLAAADDVIVNDAATPAMLAAQVDALHQRYLEFAAAAQ
ncbi:dephospho-CoA kinase [Burkholderia sp. AU19243]|uniref:Dephospho-CoA kinase n=1 Tax=Burkholderia latens TaxID=488446 RepID=A0AAP1C2R3_9BURK|nr:MULTISPECIES: dephospho-CoA kinase [Burkholderia]AIO41962.1 dephospho-CoA kinase [Burkholderia cenocepacia]MBR7961840.1 dephospho-CoA kinase [Burkholderia vietnamiensis]AOK03471.1 dephospho-CoA kinase [Burkholderia latens]KVA02924.1 dephospho-CoA kinase [Burkholderia latens]MBR8143668.1 dephospho-CoA kinase [Burkholderia vietnamiensis]